MNFLLIICAINFYLGGALPIALKADCVPSGATDCKGMPKPTKMSHSSVLVQFRKNPSAFVAQMSKANPDTLREVLGLLRGLLSTSDDRENHLITTLDGANNELNSANGDVADAQTVLSDAQTDLGNAENAVVGAESDLGEKEAVAAQKLTEKNDAQSNHDAEIDSLNEEQAMITEVIEILEDLLGRQTPSEGELTCASGYRSGDWQSYLSSWGTSIAKAAGDDQESLKGCWELAKANVQNAVGVYWDFHNGYCRAINNKAPLMPFADTYDTEQGRRSLCLLNSEV